MKERLNPNIVARTVLPDGRVVSTVKLPVEFTRYSAPYETMVFPSETKFLELECHRYETEGGALDGHNAVVARLTGAPAPEHERKPATKLEMLALLRKAHSLISDDYGVDHELAREIYNAIMDSCTDVDC